MLNNLILYEPEVHQAVIQLPALCPEDLYPNHGLCKQMSLCTVGLQRHVTTRKHVSICAIMQASWFHLWLMSSRGGLSALAR